MDNTTTTECTNTNTNTNANTNAQESKNITMTIYWRLFSITPWSDAISWQRREISANPNKKYIITSLNYYPCYSKISYYKKPFNGIIPNKHIKEQFIKYFNSKDKYFNISPLLANSYIDDSKYFLAPININRTDRYLIVGVFLLDNEIIDNLFTNYTKNMISYNIISLLNFNINRPKQSLAEKVRNSVLTTQNSGDVGRITSETTNSTNSTNTITKKYNLFRSIILDVKKSGIVVKFNDHGDKELKVKIKFGSSNNNNDTREISRNIIELLTDINGYLPSLSVIYTA
jgi:hypothetical protein